LHIALKYAERWDDMRSIKELLMKGAERQIKNKDGERPIDIVEKYVMDEEKK
jgi:hypothetical protein